MKITISMYDTSSAYVHYDPSFFERWFFGHQHRTVNVYRISVATNGSVPCISVDWVTGDNQPIDHDLVERLEDERARRIAKMAVACARGDSA